MMKWQFALEARVKLKVESFKQNFKVEQ